MLKTGRRRGLASSYLLAKETWEEIRKRGGVWAVNKSGRHTLPSTLKVAHGEAIEGRKLDFYKSWLLAKCVFVCVCAHACVFAFVLNTESHCESLGRHCYKTCSLTHKHTEYTQHFKDMHEDYSCLAMRNMLLARAHLSRHGDLCVSNCVFLLLRSRHTPFDPSVMMPLLHSLCPNLQDCVYKSMYLRSSKSSCVD